MGGHSFVTIHIAYDYDKNIKSHNFVSNMSQPQKKTINISNMLLNPNNPRFEPVKDQNTALEIMLEKKESEIKKLAQDIINHGINPTKNVLVVKSKNNKFLVLEGNRRITSLILLNKPAKIKDEKLRKFFQNLKDANPAKIPKNISCVVFKNANDANHWIMLEHTGKNDGAGVDEWDHEQKKRFLPQTPGHISILDFAVSNKISTNNVKPTNLQRLLSTSYVRDVVGISFDNGELNLNKPESQVKRNIKKVFTKMSEKNFKVKNIYTLEQRKEWINNTLDLENNSQTREDETDSSKNKTKTHRKSTDRRSLIPSDCHLAIHAPKINDIFLELRDNLSLQGSKATPNAVAVLFRVFLEVSIDSYLIDKMDKKLSQNMTITKKIEMVTKHMTQNNIAKKDQLRAIQQISTTSTKDILHIQRFHEYVHSGIIQPESASLKVKWNNLQKFFEILWSDLDKHKK